MLPGLDKAFCGPLKPQTKTVISHGSLSHRERRNKGGDREPEETEARRLLSVHAEVSVNHPDYCKKKKKKKPQRHISASSVLHKGKHQSTAV